VFVAGAASSGVMEVSWDVGCGKMRSIAGRVISGTGFAQGADWRSATDNQLQ